MPVAMPNHLPAGVLVMTAASQVMPPVAMPSLLPAGMFEVMPPAASNHYVPLVAGPRLLPAGVLVNNDYVPLVVTVTCPLSFSPISFTLL